MGGRVHRRWKRLALGAAARRSGPSRGGDVLIGGVPLYDRLSGRVGGGEGIRRSPERRCDVSWRGRWLPEVLHWSEMFVVMLTTVIEVLVMLTRTRGVEGRNLVRWRGRKGIRGAGERLLIWSRGYRMLGSGRHGRGQ